MWVHKLWTITGGRDNRVTTSVPSIMCAFDACRLNKMFWTHYRDDTISEAGLDGSDPTIIVSNINRPSESSSSSSHTVN